MKKKKKRFTSMGFLCASELRESVLPRSGWVHKRFMVAAPWFLTVVNPALSLPRSSRSNIPAKLVVIFLPKVRLAKSV